MRIRPVAAALLLFAATSVLANNNSLANDKEDAVVTAAAVSAWQESTGAKPELPTTPYAFEPAGVTDLVAGLAASGADRPLLEELAQNLLKRNEGDLEKRGSNPGELIFRLPLPGFDAQGTHAVMAGGAGNGLIRLALLERSGDVWIVTWTGTMKPPALQTVPARLPGGTGPLRVGGDVKAPVLIHRVEPIYPPEALRDRIQGIVIIEATVSKEGRVTSSRILKPLPFGLDQAALDAVQQWVFEPGTMNGEPVDVIFNLTVNFRLAKEETQ